MRIGFSRQLVTPDKLHGKSDFEAPVIVVGRVATSDEFIRFTGSKVAE